GELYQAVLGLGLRYWKEVLIGIVFLLGTIFTIFFGFSGDSNQEQMTNIGPGGTAKVSPLVLRYEPLLKQHAIQNGIDLSYIPIIEALIMQESGGRLPDVMQSSES